MVARLEDQIIEGIIGCARNADQHLPFECAAEADLDGADPANTIEALGTRGSGLAHQRNETEPAVPDPLLLGWIQRLHQALGPLQPRLRVRSQAPAHAGDDLRLTPLDGMIERRAIRVEVRGHRLFRVAVPTRFPAREMERCRVANEIDDRRTQSGVVEVGETVVVIGHRELLEMGISVDRPGRQPPAEIAERFAGPVFEGLRQRAEIAKGTRSDLVEQRL